MTLFPEVFGGYLDYSIIGRARKHGIVDISLCNIRDYSHDKHRTVDDYPYGGGAGMVMKPEPIFEAVESIRNELPDGEDAYVILLTPQGRLFNQSMANQLFREENLLIICGHYEGIDERVAEHLVNDEISVGDYLLSGGEPAAMVMVDCLVRLIPGALGSEISLVEESHSQGLLEYPQYTRPPRYRGWEVPEVLLSGNHEKISRWRREQSIIRTATKRPDLLCKAELTQDDKKILRSAGISP